MICMIHFSFLCSLTGEIKTFAYIYILKDVADFSLQEQSKDNLMVSFFSVIV